MKPIYWFGPKKHGFGIRPIHPLGFLTIFIAIAGFFAGLQILFSGLSSVFGVTVIVISIAFFAIVASLTYRK
tara:strand:+ start:634 stop:849 length:216 start_codon:yes stop_codon:yes gene_type:complete